MRWRALLTGACVALAGACEASVPGRPAWDQDVMPLLQGSCNHCHGETAGRTIEPVSGVARPAIRLDFCDGGTPALREVGVSVGLGAAAIPVIVRGFIEPDKQTGRALMPPPPAAPLTAYEYAVMDRWLKIAAFEVAPACQKAVRNRPPQVQLVEPPKQLDEAVEAVIEITDPNHDGVVGKATLGGASVEIPGAGRRTLRFPKSAPVGGALNVVVTDGYDVTRL